MTRPYGDAAGAPDAEDSIPLPYKRLSLLVMLLIMAATVLFAFASSSSKNSSVPESFGVQTLALVLDSAFEDGLRRGEGMLEGRRLLRGARAGRRPGPPRQPRRG